jgi:hypothetical protein
MKLCKVCGIPVIVGRDQVWNSNGTITMTDDERLRMGIYNMSMLTDMVSKIEEVVGPPIHQMFMEGKRRYARHYIENLLQGPLGFVVKRTKFGAKKAYQQLIDTGTALGYGHLALEVYERKERLGGKVKNPYYTPFLVGDVRAAFEAIEQLPSRAEWSDEGKDTTRVMCEKVDGEDRFDKRFVFEDKVRLAGEAHHEVCKGCGVPKALGRFKWHVGKGTIVEEATGDRYFIMGFNDINAVFTELEEALGDIIPGSVYDANRKVGLAMVKKGIIKGLDELARDMALRGMALLTHQKVEGSTTLELKNPFNRNFLLGTVMGVLEGLEGPQGEPEVVEEPGMMRITVAKEKD